MKKPFGEYCPLSEHAVQQIWEAALFMPDANTVLNFYRYTDETRESFLSLLEHPKIVDRLWLPFQVALEFHKNRVVVITEQTVPYQKIVAVIDNHINNLLEEVQKIQLHRYHPFIRKEDLVEATTNLKDALQAHLQNQASAYPNFLSADPLLERVHKLFATKLGTELGEGEKSQLAVMGEERFKAKVPPGYLDEGKGGIDKYGDFFIWREIIEKAKTEDCSVIFITDDVKEDWWYRVKGKTIGPRPELRREFKIETGHEFLIYTPAEFAKYANEYLGKVVTIDESIREMQVWKKLNAFESRKASVPIKIRVIEERAEKNDDAREGNEEGQEPSIGEMIEWFYENYEDPANGVPYESREGGYQYFAGGPYDPMEELQDQFPDVPFERIERAAEEIYGDGFEWIKKGQY